MQDNNVKEIGPRTLASLQFTELKDHELRAYKVIMAIWRNEEKHVFIGAPTLNALDEVWLQITGAQLKRESAQEVFVVKGDR